MKYDAIMLGLTKEAFLVVQQDVTAAVRGGHSSGLRRAFDVSMAVLRDDMEAVAKVLLDDAHRAAGAQFNYGVDLKLVNDKGEFLRSGTFDWPLSPCPYEVGENLYKVRTRYMQMVEDRVRSQLVSFGMLPERLRPAAPTQDAEPGSGQ